MISFRPGSVRMTCATALAAGGLLLPPSSARAGGFWLYEMGTPHLGTASAGRAALAKDAATVFGNPAGMTSLDRSRYAAPSTLDCGA